MFSKRTRLFSNFKIINILHIFQSLISKKKNFIDVLKKFLKKENIDLTSLGRTALYEIIKIIINDTKKNHFIISPYTIPAVIHSIKHAGGIVVYVDIDKTTGLINEDKLEKAINDTTAGIIITHLYSNCENIKKFIKKFSGRVSIIEDAAINFGAKVDDNYLGTLCDFGFYSFNIVKNLNTLNGGALYIKDNDKFKKYLSNKNKKNFPYVQTINLLLTVAIIKLISNNYVYQVFHYFLKLVYLKKINFILKKIYPILFHNFEKKLPQIYSYDFNWIMNDVAIYNLKRIEKNYNERCAKAKLYNKLISDKVATKTNCFSSDNALLEYTLILKNIDNRKAHTILMRNGYDVRHTWYINNLKKYNDKEINNFKDTNQIEDKVFCLPLHPNISETDIINITNIINNFK